MAKHTVILGSVMLISIVLLTGNSLSGTNTPPQKTNPREQFGRLRQRAVERRRQYSQERADRLKNNPRKRPPYIDEKRKKEAKQRSLDAKRQAIGATEEQWKIIEPRFKKVQAVGSKSSMSIGQIIYGGSAASSSGGSSSARGAGGYRAAGAGGGASGGYSAGATGARGRAGARVPSGRVRSPNRRTSAPASQRRDGQVRSSWNWAWSKPSQRKSPDKLTKGEIICEELFDMAQSRRADPEKIRHKMAQLRQARQEAQGELAQARQELREVLTPRQEAKLILMRYLN